MRKYSIILILSGLMALFSESALAQVTVLEPLFEYPTAPDELTDLEARSNFIVSNFWRQFDFDKKFVGQTQLNHAFGVFAAALPWANPKVTDDAIDHLLGRLKKKPGLVYQFTVAAEENLYGPKANFWIDDIYLKFLDMVLRQKKIPASSAARFSAQRSAINGCRPGNPFPPLKFKSADGKEENIGFSKLTIIEFGSMTDAESRYEKLMLETDTDLSRMVDNGELDIWFVETGDAQAEDGNLPAGWVYAVPADNLISVVDFRFVPSLYLIGEDGKIVSKNLRSDAVKAAVKNITLK